MGRPYATGCHQRGLSVVEILISLTLSLALVVGVSGMVVGSRKTSLVEQNLVDMQATGRAVLQIYANELRKAGYRSDPETAAVDVFPADSAGTSAGVNVEPFTQAGSVIGKSTKNWSRDGAFTVRYQGTSDGLTSDCVNRKVGAGETVWVNLMAHGGGVLCRSYARATGALSSAMLLSQQIERQWIAFGVDEDGDTFADAYYDTDSVTDWSRVASVNVQVRVVSMDDFLVGSPQPFVDFDGTVVTPADHRLRRTYATVIALRNVLP